MDNEARDQANAALALDDKIKDRIREVILEVLEGFEGPQLLRFNPYFEEVFRQLLNAELHSFMERNLEYYLRNIHHKY